MANTLIPSQLWEHSLGPIPRARRSRTTAGFTLLEMLVGIALMVVLGGMVFSLFNRHVKVYKLQQEVTELNLGLRSAMDLISADLMNAGASLSAGGFQRFPFPVIVQKRASGNFDSITIYQGYKSDDTINFLAPTTLTSCDGVEPVRVDRNTLCVNPAPDKTPAETAALLSNGSYVVIVNTNRNDPNYGQIAPFTLAGGSTAANCGVNLCVQIATGGSTDPYSGLLRVPADKVGILFPTGSMVVKLGPVVTYSVDDTDPDRPVLNRTMATSTSAPVLALVSNVLGFSQQARLGRDLIVDDPANYVYPDGTPAANNFSLIQYLEVTISGRTQSNRIDEYQTAIDPAHPTRTFRLNSLTTVVAIRNQFDSWN